MTIAEQVAAMEPGETMNACGVEIVLTNKRDKSTGKGYECGLPGGHIGPHRWEGDMAGETLDGNRWTGEEARIAVAIEWYGPDDREHDLLAGLGQEQA